MLNFHSVQNIILLLVSPITDLTVNFYVFGMVSPCDDGSQVEPTYHVRVEKNAK